MPYIGNTIRAADDYRLIDDISSSFNGSTTSFALQVAGSSPVPFPKSPQQVLISVNGVIQEPDPTGASGFNLVGTNIVFSSAPTNGHAFFGIIYATADYLNAGGNFPSGSVGAPSFTFIGDEDTGIYRKGSGSVGFVSNSTEIANTDSNGITISSGGLILGDSSGASSNRIKLGASGDLEIYHSGNDSFIVDQGTGGLVIQGSQTRIRNSSGHTQINASNDIVELYYDNSKKFETLSSGVKASGHIFLDDNNKFIAGTGSDLQIYHDGSNSYIDDSGTGSLIARTNQFLARNISNDENMIVATANGSVDLYYNNAKQLETRSNGIGLDNSLFLVDSKPIYIGNHLDLTIQHNGSNSIITHNGTGDLLINTADGEKIYIDTSEVVFRNSASNETLIKATQNGAVELYHDNAKKAETVTGGFTITGTCTATSFAGDGSNLTGITTDLVNDTSPQLGGALDTNEHNIAFGDSSGTNNDRLKFGDGGDLAIYHDGTNNYIQGNNQKTIIRNTSNNIHLQAVSGEAGIDILPNANVKLYFDGSNKLQTVSTGISVTGNIVQTGNLNVNDNANLNIGNSGDLQLFHNGTNSFIDSDTGNLVISSVADLRFNSADYKFMNVADNETLARFVQNGAVELYFDNAKTFETIASGAKLQKSGVIDLLLGSTNAGGVVLSLDGDSNGDGAGGDFAFLSHNTSGHLQISTANPSGNSTIEFRTNGTHRATVSATGMFEPALNNTYDLGTTSLRWRNIYTNDLNLSNEGGSNDVDSTWGDYTIQEGFEDLFLINNRTGKKFKFNLTEVA